MKKTILTGVALMGFAAVTFGQTNTATLNQVGNQQTGNATQVGSSLTSNIQQTTASGITNVGNYANTSQKPLYYGSQNNQAAVNQLGTKSGFASIGQEGSGNQSTVSQKNNNGGSGTAITAASGPGTVQDANNAPNQSGIDAVKAAGGNYTNTYQRGKNQVVTVNQNDGATGNYTDTRQDDNNGPQTATVNQNTNSSNNKATANQFGDNNTLNVSQSDNSDNNQVNVRQGYSGAVGGPNSIGGTAIVEQNGDVMGSSSTNQATITQVNNSVQTATIQQNNDSQRNKATIDQSSPNGNNGNQATIHQSNVSADNEAIINQTAGAGRTATIEQVDNSVHNLANIQQKGTTPGATVNTAYIIQTRGSDNQAFINQDTRISALARINQHDGNASYARITQNTTYFDYGNTNVAEIEQTGGVTGGGNTATIDQDYSANTTKLKQDGTSNMATIKQLLGDYNVVKGIGSDIALQQGDHNMLTVTQESTNRLGAPFGSYVPNTANVSQMGSYNTATISQSGTPVTP